MSVKRTGQLGFVDALVGGSVERASRLDRIAALVSWESFAALLGGLETGGPGRPGYPALVMFKVVLLQSLHGLSDADTEAMVADRLSFRRFAGLSLADAVPDHTTICRFRKALVEAGLLERLFGELDRQLEAAGLVLKRGTLLDATVIETAAARPPGRSGKTVDAQAGFGKRTGKPGFRYGYKAHAASTPGRG